ncbi:MAG: methionine adenosyltransferase [Euryarchaeota archaeon]|mgnify:CR=1 FL=1|nr:methionine adenosyltransferase [Euryarchaeota archaeon]|tara:strand:- start:16673 stop:17929 length:1257 start_codon:yes stop_codon:yes gene_type:complete
MAERLPPARTAESVTAGHPDKLCDAISDSILDACLAIDPNARVAVETLVKGTEDKAFIVLAGEVTLAGEISDAEYESIARTAACEIGYTNHSIGMDATSSETCEVTVLITTQSQFISQGVDGDIDSQGAGDQGIMFGYACKETEGTQGMDGRLMPLPAALAQRICRRLDMIVSNGEIPWIRPDGKSQVTVEYGSEGNPSHVQAVVVAVQHDDALKEQFGGDIDAEQEFVREQIRKHVVEHAIPPNWLSPSYTLIVNGTGRFADPGGPYSDAGLTGRKIIVDTYGGGMHGGGAFSGKDPSKVDRTAAYHARWAAKHVVAAGLADRCEIQVSYAIGVPTPISLLANTSGTGTIPDEELSHRILSVFDWRPAAMIRDLGLKRPIYRKTASGGHFGRTPTSEGHFPWEAIRPELTEALKNQQ